jgi:hypothetical protein
LGVYSLREDMVVIPFLFVLFSVVSYILVLSKTERTKQSKRTIDTHERNILNDNHSVSFLCMFNLAEMVAGFCMVIPAKHHYILGTGDTEGSISTGLDLYLCSLM